MSRASRLASWRRYKLRRYYRHKARALALLGGRCARCGDDGPDLQFDHTNGHKRDNVTRLLSYR